MPTGLPASPQGLGVHAGNRVAIVSLNSDRYAEYLLAVPRAGAAFNPVNIRWSPAEIAYSPTDSDTHVLLKPYSILLHAAPMFHLADLAAWCGLTILGGTHVMVPFFEPISVFKAMAEHRATDVLLVPNMIQLLVDHPESGFYDLSSMEQMLYGGSAISEGVLQRTKARFPGVRLTQAYWNNPEQSAEPLRGGWLHTGDLGYFDARGFVYVVDRLKDMIVTGGEVVYSAEVENALSKHPAVASSAVIGIPDEHYGERVHAVVVLAPGQMPLPKHCGTFAVNILPGTRFCQL